MQNLITSDVFQMIDNLSQALTEKESEVEGVKRRLHADIRDQQENQKSMELKFSAMNNRYEEMI